MVQSITEREACELELLGAQKRLARVEAELEFFFGRKDGDERERHRLEIEFDEAQRQVLHARQAVDGL